MPAGPRVYLLLAAGAPAEAVRLYFRRYTPAPGQGLPVVVLRESDNVPPALEDVAGTAMRAAYRVLAEWQYIGGDRFCLGIDLERPAPMLQNAGSAALPISLAFAAAVAASGSALRRPLHPRLAGLFAATGALDAAEGRRVLPVDYLPEKAAAARAELERLAAAAGAQHPVPEPEREQPGQGDDRRFYYPAAAFPADARPALEHLARLGFRTIPVQTLEDALKDLGFEPPARSRHARRLRALLAALVAAAAVAGVAAGRHYWQRPRLPAEVPVTAGHPPLDAGPTPGTETGGAEGGGAVAAPEPPAPVGRNPEPVAAPVPPGPSVVAPGSGPAAGADPVPETAPAREAPPAAPAAAPVQILLRGQPLVDQARVGDAETLLVSGAAEVAVFVAAGTPADYYRQGVLRLEDGVIGVEAHFGRPGLDAGWYGLYFVISPPPALAAADKLDAAAWANLIHNLPPERLLYVQVRKDLS